MNSIKPITKLEPIIINSYKFLLKDIYRLFGDNRIYYEVDVSDLSDSYLRKNNYYMSNSEGFIRLLHSNYKGQLFKGKHYIVTTFVHIKLQQYLNTYMSSFIIETKKFNVTEAEITKSIEEDIKREDLIFYTK